MTGSQPDPARIAAFHVLDQVINQGAFSHECLSESDLLLALSDRETKFATALVYGVLNRKLSLDYILAHLSQRPLTQIDPAVRVILGMGLWQLYYAYAVPDFAAVDESVKLCHYARKSRAAGFVNAILRRFRPEDVYFRTKDKGIELGLGNELFGLFKAWYGETAALDLGEYYLREDFPLCIQVNRKRTNVKTLSAKLLEEGVDVQPGRFFPDCLYLNLRQKRLEALPGFQQGAFWVQAEAAQAVGYLAGAETAHRLWDLCAAPGGKSLDLASRMPAQAQLVAMDLKADRLSLVAENAKRLGLPVAISVQDATDPHLLAKLAAQYPFCREQPDLILADVPCSGLGLLARKPELRWRMGYEDLKRFPPIQQAILENAARLLASGGRLIYATCTLNPAENQDLVTNFLASPAGENFRLLTLESHLPESLLEALAQDAQVWQLMQKGYLLFRPDVVGGDGFFVCMLQKTER